MPVDGVISYGDTYSLAHSGANSRTHALFHTLMHVHFPYTLKASIAYNKETPPQESKLKSSEKEQHEENVGHDEGVSQCVFGDCTGIE